MDYIKIIVPSGAEDLVNYFDSIYVNSTLCRIGTNNDISIRFCRLPSQFSSPMWNVHQTTLLDSSKINNVCEG